MEKNYDKIEFEAGSSIDSAVEQIKDYKGLACGTFNGQVIFSDIDDLDSAYKKITGKTKVEFDEEMQKKHDEYEAEKLRHEEAVPELTKEWIEKGKKVLDEKHHSVWIECVPIRLKDLYHGMELGNCLDIIKELNNGCELDVAKRIIEEQGHSGMSFNLVCSMVKSFCDRGNEFINYVK